jgi:alpha-galactosidase-like CBM13-containing protein
VKKQINPSAKPHLLRSALILLSLVTFNQDIFCQTPTPTTTATPSPTATATPSPTATACSIPTPGACTSYEAESSNNTLEGSAFVLSCPTCSGGFKVGYVGSNSGTLQFNGVGVVAPGNHTVTICYTNGDAVRYALLSVNGGPGMPVSFPSTGSFQTVGSIQITITLNTGCNTLEFSNPIVGSWAPDFDRIQFNCPTCTVSATGPPIVTTNPATLIASFSARLNGSLNPHGLPTTFHFQYGTTTSYGLTTPPQSRSGNASQNVSANVSSLMANRVYHFRIKATNMAGTRFGADRTFTTLSATGPPIVTTNAATNVASHSATLNGLLNPHGLSTSVNFQYGTTTSYGSTTPTQTRTGNTYRNISANISGLMSNHIYHFRMKATNMAGTRFGNDRTFTTGP